MRHALNMSRLIGIAALFSVASLDARTQVEPGGVVQPSATCLGVVVPASEGIKGQGAQLETAARELLITTLADPSLKVIALEARLRAPAIEEARKADCGRVLMMTLKQKTGGGGVRGLTGKVAEGAGTWAAWSVPGGRLRDRRRERRVDRGPAKRTSEGERGWRRPADAIDSPRCGTCPRNGDHAIGRSMKGFGWNTPASAGACSVACLSACIGATLIAAPGDDPAQTIPLCAGLTIVTAIQQTDGDYESIKTIEAVDPQQVRLKYSVEKMQYPGLFDSHAPFLRKITIPRIVLAADLRSATSYQQRFLEKSEVDTVPGTTAIGTSAANLAALKKTGTARMEISDASDSIGPWSADRKKTPNYYQHLTPFTLKRVGSGPIKVPMLVNDAIVELPAIHAAGDRYGNKAEFIFLDDERNPLTLSFRLGVDEVKPLTPEARETCKNHPNEARIAHRCDLPDGGDRETLRVVKIAHRCPNPGTSQPSASGGNALERALTEKRAVDIYSVHFTFNSDSIREESEPTLQEIADVLRRHPEWKVLINGHTDGVGAPDYNVDLSKRRADAVKAALVSRHAIDAKRLTAWGLGEAYPKDTNETLDGRARNRRVELKRQ
jgi:outer membrane protein OmpA-like peptidoglycan-associated protein